jgi:hypothetical protein
MKVLTWRSVSGGIAAFIAIVVLLFVVLTYARTGVLRGDKFRLYVAVPDASDVLKGTDVWLNGQRVGTVAEVSFAPPSAPVDARVVIAADVLSSMREHIRLDSRADLRSGGTIIGAPVVYLSSGTIAARPVSPGDTLHGAGKSDFEVAASRATEALAEVPGILSDAKIIMGNAKTTGARVGGIVRAGDRHSFAVQASALMQKMSSGRGFVPRARRDDALQRRVARTMAASDTLRTMLATRMDEFGRFRRDSTLGRSVQLLRDDVARLRTLASSPTGTVGRITTDSALTRSLDSLFAELTTLMADIKKNPLRYARVF